MPKDDVRASERQGGDAQLLLKVVKWLDERANIHASKDLDCNWNDPGQPGDGSCLTIREQALMFSKSQPAPSADAAMARWAVEVLDAHLLTYPKEFYYGWEVSRDCDVFYVEFCDGSRNAIDGPWDGVSGPTPDAARIVAAKALREVDPSLPAPPEVKP